MKKGDKTASLQEQALEINKLVKSLEKNFKKLKAAYHRKDPREFNLLKKEILLTQRRIHSISK